MASGSIIGDKEIMGSLLLDRPVLQMSTNCLKSICVRGIARSKEASTPDDATALPTDIRP